MLCPDCAALRPHPDDENYCPKCWAEIQRYARQLDREIAGALPIATYRCGHCGQTAEEGHSCPGGRSKNYT